MTTDKPQHGPVQSGAAVASRGAFDKASKLFFFKKAMTFSAKDYVVICCMALILLVFGIAVAYINPFEYFHISKQQIGELTEKIFQALAQKTVGKQVFATSVMIQEYIRELITAAGWNSVVALMCFLPFFIFFYFFIFFPFFFLFCAVFRRELKEMIQQWERSPHLQDNNHLAE
ncbi:hypothetical protein ME7_00836 [Bartonella birtlesii LL-WM9]|uniref:Uncharacterized protein n=1 Tax=Bartonella birtlesii LL-WM9 TaxID=1094552 RepID=J0Q1Z5_9HYPH|nr:hypothetical protein [Bartonella birtlesii]EJF76579.1 hypothetical protein ME7_00836 [Bartonella birtlesii LL-WM9]